MHAVSWIHHLQDCTTSQRSQDQERRGRMVSWWASTASSGKLFSFSTGKRTASSLNVAPLMVCSIKAWAIDINLNSGLVFQVRSWATLWCLNCATNGEGCLLRQTHLLTTSWGRNSESGSKFLSRNTHMWIVTCQLWSLKNVLKQQKHSEFQTRKNS